MRGTGTRIWNGIRYRNDDCDVENYIGIGLFFWLCCFSLSVLVFCCLCNFFVIYPTEKKEKSSGGQWSWLAWIRCVEVSDKLGVVIKFGREDPRGFFISSFITRPYNQIQQLALLSPIVDLGI
jgi:hypothetical protein